MKKLTAIILTTAILATTSCASYKIKNIDLYTKSELQESEFAPKGELNEKSLSYTPTVALTAFTDETSNEHKDNNLSEHLRSTVQSWLSDNKLATIVDRKKSKALEEEIKLAELKSDTSYNGPRIADLALGGSINSTNVAYNFVNNPVSGESSVEYIASVSATVDVYELPSLVAKQKIELNAEKKFLEAAPGSNIKSIFFSFSKTDTAAIEAAVKKNGGYFLKEAFNRAIEENKHKLYNIFSPSAYIVEKKNFGDKFIFKIYMGADKQLKPGMKVNITAKVTEVDPVTGKDIVDTIKLGSGMISDQITERFAWIIVKDPAIALKVRKWDIAQVEVKQSKKSILYKLGDVAHTLNKANQSIGGIQNYIGKGNK